MIWRESEKTCEILWSPFQFLFWQSLCHSNGLRKIRKKCTVSSLSQLFFARLLFSEAAGNLKVHLCLLCIIGNYEIMLENLFSVLLHCRLPQRQCSAGGSSGIHVMCVLILMCHREPHLRFAAVNIKMQIFEKKKDVFRSSSISIRLRDLKIRLPNSRRLKHMASRRRKKSLLHRRHVRQRERFCAAHANAINSQLFFFYWLLTTE